MEVIDCCYILLARIAFMFSLLSILFSGPMFLTNIGPDEYMDRNNCGTRCRDYALRSAVYQKIASVSLYVSAHRYKVFISDTVRALFRFLPKRLISYLTVSHSYPRYCTTYSEHDDQTQIDKRSGHHHIIAHPRRFRGLILMGNRNQSDQRLISHVIQ